MLRPYTRDLFNGSAAQRLRAFLAKPDPARASEVQVAGRILEAAPLHAPPLEIARYFEALVEVNEDGNRYNAEWPGTRENPVIVAFFLQATDSLPYDSDETPWCAAFLNWCLRRSGRAGTKSASSGSFRCAGAPAAAPSAGDIAVFKLRGHDESCRGQGHVAFFIEDLGVDVSVLGGNQSDRVMTSNYHRTFSAARSNALVSIRDIASFE